MSSAGDGVVVSLFVIYAKQLVGGRVRLGLVVKTELVLGVDREI